MLKSSRTFDPVNDDKNWKILFDTHFQNLQGLNAISTLWISGFSKLGIDQGRRPLADQLTTAVKPHTGYTFVQTDQNIILEQIDWYKMIAKYQMPLTNFVRIPEELDYCDEPDIWHDIMGHIPFLAEKEYSDMYQLLANTYIMAYNSERQDLIMELDFIGGMIIELGLIREPSGLKALGSTFYSSAEVFEAYIPKNQRAFTTDALQSGESYDRNSFQGQYYIIDSMDHLTDTINGIKQRL